MGTMVLRWVKTARFLQVKVIKTNHQARQRKLGTRKQHNRVWKIRGDAFDAGANPALLSVDWMGAMTITKKHYFWNVRRDPRKGIERHKRRKELIQGMEGICL